MHNIKSVSEASLVVGDTSLRSGSKEGKGGGEKVSPGEEGGEGMEYLEMAIVGIFVVVFIILRKMASVGEFSQYLIPF
jgi:hypothetical protein